MASDDEDHTATIYTDEQDLEEEDDADDLIDDEEQTHQIDDEENDDVDLIDDDEDADAEADADEDDEEEDAEEDDIISISSAGAGDVTVAGIPIIGDTQTAATPTTVTTSTVTTLQQNNNNNSVTTEITKKPLVDDSRRLFQRLWTDEDEIELLQGFYEYITERGFINSNHHHDTTAFYDQIKGKLQLDFNKNQLVEKLRRLKKKYRNVLSKISAGKEYVFKSPHDQATFDLSCKIWNESVSVCAVPVTAVPDGGGFYDEEMVNVDGNANVGFNLNENNGTEIGDSGSLEKKGSRSRKRSRSTPATVKVEENYDQKQQQYGQGVRVGTGVGAGVSNVLTPNVVEETVKSCLLPLFKELVNSSMNGARGLGLGIGGMNVGAFGGGSMGFQMGDMSDEKWRKQHILELEVYSKRLELMQDQIKSKLEELKSMGS